MGAAFSSDSSGGSIAAIFVSSCSAPTDITDSWSQLASAVQSGSRTVAIAPTPNGTGYWETQENGTVAAFGSAQNYGSLSGQINSPIVGMASTPDGKGYWLVGSDGGIFSFGDATFYGSTGSLRLNKPIVGMATTPNGKGYWMVASDGGIFSFGDAEFFGSIGGKPLNQPIVGIAADPATGGYWEVATDGGIFSYNAPFYGSTGSIHLNRPIVGMEASPNGQGYRRGLRRRHLHLRASALRRQHRKPEPGGAGRGHGGRQCHQRVLDGGGRRRHLHLRRRHLLRAGRQHAGLTVGEDRRSDVPLCHHTHTWSRRRQLRRRPDLPAAIPRRSRTRLVQELLLQGLNSPGDGPRDEAVLVARWRLVWEGEGDEADTADGAVGCSCLGLLLPAAALAGVAAPTQAVGATSSAPVAKMTMTFVDTSRSTPPWDGMPARPSRTLVTTIWYPARSGSADRSVRLPTR